MESANSRASLPSRRADLHFNRPPVHRAPRPAESAEHACHCPSRPV